LTLAPGAENAQFVGPLADAYRRLDPEADGWQSEVVGQATQEQLNRLANWITNGTGAGDLATIVTQEFVMDDLLPPHARVVFRRDSLVVTRAETEHNASGRGKQDANSGRGASALRRSLAKLASRFQAGHPEHVKFKVYRASPRENEVDTLVHCHADGATQDGLLEISTTWRCRWTMTESSPPRLTELRVDDFEMVELTGRTEPLFADCTASILAHEKPYHRQLLLGTDHWRARICRDLGLDVVANHGLALGDVNGDRLDDVYVCQEGGLPNLLFLQRPDGTLADVSDTNGTDWLDYCASALIVDLDNDGDRDLVVGQETRLLFMKNDGNAHFELACVVPASAQVFSLAAADFDNDGDVDIYVCGYNPLQAIRRTGALGEPIPYHDAQNGGENLLLRNEDDWRFVDVASEVGLDTNNNRFSFAASWEDFDNDGDLDLYVANDYGRNNLYRNDNGHFQDAAAELGVEDMSAGMAVSWGDFNRDGWMDFYVSNMFSAAGNRITFQRQFQVDASERVKRQFQRHARGNSLFANVRGQRFDDVSVGSRVTIGRWAWGNKFVDFNNDGWEDLVVANGFITAANDTGDL
jgi:hypothetical protein